MNRYAATPLRRYEHDHPGSLIHVDVTKFGNIPDGGGWRYVGRVQSRLNAQATARRTGQRGKEYRRRIGTAYLDTVIDDHSRVAYAEISGDERAATAIGVLNGAVTWFADRGVTIERVLSDNGRGIARDRRRGPVSGRTAQAVRAGPCEWHSTGLSPQPPSADR